MLQVRANFLTSDRPPAAASTLTRVPIEYTTSLDGVEPEHLDGFFERWPSPPSPPRHVDVLRGSYRVVLAREAGSPQVIGFVNAISDGVLYAYIPLLEVLPSHRGRGIGASIARALAEVGADVAIGARSADQLEAVAGDVRR